MGWMNQTWLADEWMTQRIEEGEVDPQLCTMIGLSFFSFPPSFTVSHVLFFLEKRKQEKNVQQFLFGCTNNDEMKVHFLCIFKKKHNAEILIK